MASIAVSSVEHLSNRELVHLCRQLEALMWNTRGQSPEDLNWANRRLWHALRAEWRRRGVQLSLF